MSYSVADLIALGGPVMWLLLLCAIITVAIIVERGVALGRADAHAHRLLEEISDAVRRNKVAEALAMCDRTRGPIARLIRVGLLKSGRPRDDVRHAIEDASAREIPDLERHLAALGTMAQVAPLLGLLGTTLGLIRCFHVLQVKAASLQPVGPSDVAAGFWQALLTTTAGLAIAIPAVIAYNYFARRIQRFLWSLEVATTDLLARMSGEET